MNYKNNAVYYALKESLDKEGFCGKIKIRAINTDPYVLITYKSRRSTHYLPLGTTWEWLRTVINDIRYEVQNP